MNHKMLRLFLAALLPSAGICAGQTTFTAGKPVVVMTPDEITKMGFHYPDMQLCPIPGKGNPPLKVRWMHGIGSANAGFPAQVFEGALDRPGQTRIFVKKQSGYFSDPNRAGGNKWLMSIYQHSRDLLIGVCHVENAGSGGNLFRIGIAFSTNGGDSWTYLGHSLVSAVDDEKANIAGGAWAIKDEFFHVFFIQNGGAAGAVARASMKDLLEAVRDKRPVPFHKFANGEWAMPGLSTGDATTLNVPQIGNHNNVRRCRRDDRFYQVVYSVGKDGNALHLCQSSDLIHWTDLGPIGSGTSRLFYLTMLDVSGEAGDGTIGEAFYVYYADEVPNARPSPPSPGNWDKGNSHGYYRLRVDLKTEVPSENSREHPQTRPSLP